MKTHYIKKLFFSLLLLVSFNSSLLQAQMLNEIPNPNGFTLNFFSGGENSNLFFEYVDFSFNPELFYYNGLDLNAVPLPADTQFPFYSHEYDGSFYITAFDVNFNLRLYEYDGVSAELFELPVGFQFNNYVATFQGDMYVTLFDINFNTFLYKYDGTNFIEVPAPPGLIFNNFIAEQNGLMLLSYFDDTTFDSEFFAFDGTNLAPIPGFPVDATFIFLAFEGENTLYLGVQDASFQTILYEFDGTNLVELPTPPGLIFSFVEGENSNLGELYINYFDDITFVNSLLVYDGSSMIEVPVPAGFDFPNLVNVTDDASYISFFDNVNFNNILFRYQNGVLDQVDAPINNFYSQYLDNLSGDIYYVFNDPAFNPVLMKLDEATNSVTEIPGPVGFTYSFYSGTLGNKLLLVYNDPAFNQSLWLFDGTNFVQIENPANKFFSFLMVIDDEKAYLRYDSEIDFTGTLYVLSPNSLPTSIDNTVTTAINVPYFFNTDDFVFADPDPNDIFTDILITEIEQVGYLLWDGAHVYEGDIIPFDEINNMTFTPLTDEMGSPYDAFKFKVGDGQAFSEESYTMTIIVEEPNAISGNELNVFTNIYPIPASSFTTVEINAETAIGAMSLRIFSSAGKLVQQQQYDGLGNTFREVLDVSMLPAGSYFIVGSTELGNMAKPLQINR